MRSSLSLYLLLILSVFEWSGCRSRAVSTSSVHDGGELSSEEQERAREFGRIADIIAEGLLLEATGKAGGWEEFVNPKIKRAGLWERYDRYQSLVCDYYPGLSPKFRNPADMAEALQVSLLQAEATLLFFNIEGDLTFESSEGARILSQLMAEAYERENAEFITYLRESIPHKTVKDMAKEKGITQQELYEKAWLLDVSFVDVWRTPYSEEELNRVREVIRNEFHLMSSDLAKADNPLSMAEAVIDKNIEPEKVIDRADLLKVNAEALANILHHIGRYQVGRVWEDW